MTSGRMHSSTVVCREMTVQVGPGLWYKLLLTFVCPGSQCHRCPSIITTRASDGTLLAQLEEVGFVPRRIIALPSGVVRARRLYLHLASNLALHELDEMWPTSQEEFVVVGPPIWSCAFSDEVPPRDLPCKRGILGEGEEVRHHVLHKGVLVDDLLYSY